MIFVLIFLLSAVPVYAEPTATEEFLSNNIDSYGELLEKSFFDDEGFSSLFPGTSRKELLSQLVKGKLELSVSGMFSVFSRFFFHEVYLGAKAMLMIFLLAVLCSYLMGLKDNFGEQGATSAGFYACYLVIAGIAAASFYNIAGCVGETVEQIALFMKMIVPVVITALISCGAVVSASVFEPILLTVVEASVGLIQTVLIPLVMVATALQIVNHLSDKLKIHKLVKFMNQCIKWSLSIMLTVFVSVAGMQSIASGGADALAVKLSKFATANLIPVVGGILAESVETIMNCSVLIKNAVGIFGILALGILAVFPLLKVGATVLLFRLTAAVCEPVSDPKIVHCLSEISNGVAILFSILTAVTAMFIMALTIVIHAGNTVVMLGR